MNSYTYLNCIPYKTNTLTCEVNTPFILLFVHPAPLTPPTCNLLAFAFNTENSIQFQKKKKKSSSHLLISSRSIMVQQKCSKTDQQIPEILSEPIKTQQQQQQQQHSNKQQQLAETEEEHTGGMVFQSCSNTDQQISEIPSEPTENKLSNDHKQFELQQAQISIPIGDITKKHTNSDEKPSPPEVSSREKLKRHRMEVAGQVWIPDSWGQEELLKDWIDCSAFESSLSPHGIVLARAALIRKKTVRDL